MKKSMRIRTAKKIVKVINEDGLEEAVRRYGGGRVEKAQRKWKGLPDKDPPPEPVVLNFTPEESTVDLSNPDQPRETAWEQYQRLISKPKRKRSAERYRNLKDRNSKLAKLKYPWIK